MYMLIRTANKYTRTDEEKAYVAKRDAIYLKLRKEGLLDEDNLSWNKTPLDSKVGQHKKMCIYYIYCMCA
jgi:hypothetical protein